MTLTGSLRIDLTVQPELNGLRGRSHGVGMASAHVPVGFERPFAAVPAVIAAISGVNLQSSQAMHLKVEPTQITQGSFTLTLTASDADWTDSVLISWLATDA